MSSIQQVNQLIPEWNKLMPALTSENKKKLDNKFRMEFNYNSNHIEGNTLTYGETKLLLIFDETTGNHHMREYEEMKAHDVAYKLITEMATDANRPLTESAIKSLNEIILVRSYWKEAITPYGQHTRRQIKVGEYKTHPNSVKLQNGDVFEYASPIDTPIQMGELLNWFRQEEAKNELQPVELAALLHYKFVCIHPFDDGNGRISRLLMNYVLLRNQLPPVIIQSDAKSEYLRALHSADAGNLSDFIEYIARQLIWSLNISIQAAKGLTINEQDDWEKRIQLLKQKVVEESAARYNKQLPRASVEWVCQKALPPLFAFIETRLVQLEALFLNRKTVLSADTESITAKQLNFTWEQIAANDALLQNLLSGHCVQVNFIFGGLTGFDNTMLINAEGFELHFNANEYEIKYNSNRNSARKPYTQSLNEGTVHAIADTIVYSILDTIESVTA